jgi:hypothetical protein
MQSERIEFDAVTGIEHLFSGFIAGDDLLPYLTDRRDVGRFAPERHAFATPRHAATCLEDDLRDGCPLSVTTPPPTWHSTTAPERRLLDLTERAYVSTPWLLNTPPAQSALRSSIQLPAPPRFHSRPD